MVSEVNLLSYRGHYLFDTRLQIEYSSRVSAKAALIGIGVLNCIGAQRRSFLRAAFLLSAKGVTRGYTLASL